MESKDAIKRPAVITLIGYVIKILNLIALGVILAGMVGAIVIAWLGSSLFAGGIESFFLLFGALFMLGIFLVNGVMGLIVHIYTNALLRLERKGYVVYMVLLGLITLELVVKQLYQQSMDLSALAILIPVIIMGILYMHRNVFVQEGDKAMRRRANRAILIFLIGWVVTAIIVGAALMSNAPAGQRLNDNGTNQSSSRDEEVDTIMAGYRNAERQREVEQLASGIEYYIQNVAKGDVSQLNLSTCPDTELIDSAAYGSDGKSTLEPVLNKYMAPFPHDPQPTAAGDYATCVDSAGRVTVSAPSAESGKVISFTTN